MYIYIFIPYDTWTREVCNLDSELATSTSNLAIIEMFKIVEWSAYYVSGKSVFDLPSQTMARKAYKIVKTSID